MLNGAQGGVLAIKPGATAPNRELRQANTGANRINNPNLGNNGNNVGNNVMRGGGGQNPGAGAMRPQAPPRAMMMAPPRGPQGGGAPHINAAPRGGGGPGSGGGHGQDKR